MRSSVIGTVEKRGCLEAKGWMHKKSMFNQFFIQYANNLSIFKLKLVKYKKLNCHEPYRGESSCRPAWARTGVCGSADWAQPGFLASDERAVAGDWDRGQQSAPHSASQHQSELGNKTRAVITAYKSVSEWWRQCESSKILDSLTIWFMAVEDVTHACLGLVMTLESIHLQLSFTSISLKKQSCLPFNI